MTPIPGTGLSVAQASPDDPRIDELFAGNEPWTVEVVEDIQDREDWERDRRLWQVFQGGEVVAWAMLTFWNKPHPDATSPSKAPYYAILDLLVMPAFQGRKDDVSGRSIARVVLEWIESRARARRDCVGMTLVVQDDNVHAIGVYRHFGFEVAGSIVEPCVTYLEMRKIF